MNKNNSTYKYCKYSCQTYAKNFFKELSIGMAPSTPINFLVQTKYEGNIIMAWQQFALLLNFVLFKFVSVPCHIALSMSGSTEQGDL